MFKTLNYSLLNKAIEPSGSFVYNFIVMKILLTNDDGYNARGIAVLKRCLSKYGRVIIVAPSRPMSAQSTSLTVGKGMQLIYHGEDTYSFSGTPADCVAFALSSMDFDFDIVVSGCNEGLNISYDTIYSGTIGACLEACVFRKKSIAISCHVNDFEKVEENFDKLWMYINKRHLLGTRYLLNVNFPRDDVLGIEIGRLHYRKDEFYFVKEEDGFHAYRKCETDFDSFKGTDEYQVSHGIISIVPLSRTNFSEEIYNELIHR